MIKLGLKNLGKVIMQCGYLGLDEAVFNVFTKEEMKFFKENANFIEDYLSHLLNEPGCSDKTFSVSLCPTKKSLSYKSVDAMHEIYETRLKEKIVLGLSGGLDSMTSWLILKNAYRIKPLGVFFVYGQPQMSKEMKALLSLSNRYKIPVKVDNLGINKTGIRKYQKESSKDFWPIDGFKIPARNFSIVAGMTPFLDIETEEPVVALGVYKDEIMPKNRDKSSKFFIETQNLLRLYYDNDNIKFISPIATLSKIDMIKYLKGIGEIEFVLKNTRTCVSNESDPCMNCKPCFNRTLSIVLAGHIQYLPEHWFIDLHGSEVLKEYQDNIDKYEGKRRKDIEKFSGIVSIRYKKLMTRK